MTKILFFLVLITFSSTLFSQNLVLKDSKGDDFSNDTVTHTGLVSDALLEYTLKVINNGSTAIDVKVLKQEISVVDGTENYFCWKECYEPSVFESPDALTVETGDANSQSFIADYKPNSNNGISKIRYKLFNVNDANDTVTVMMVFDVSTTSIASDEVNDRISEPYPKPASDFVSIDYRDIEKGSFKLYNLSGRMLKQINLQERTGKLVVHSKEYPAGIYIYKISDSKGLLKSGKIVFK